MTDIWLIFIIILMSIPFIFLIYFVAKISKQYLMKKMRKNINNVATLENEAQNPISPIFHAGNSDKLQLEENNTTENEKQKNNIEGIDYISTPQSCSRRSDEISPEIDEENFNRIVQSQTELKYTPKF